MNDFFFIGNGTRVIYVRRRAINYIGIVNLLL